MPTSFISGRSRLPLYSLVALDVAIAFGCGELAELIRFGAHSSHFTVLMYIQALLVVVLSFLCDVYGPWRGRSFSERFTRVLLAWSLSFVGLVTFLVMSKTMEQYSRVWLGTWIVTAIPLAVILRLFLYQLLMMARRQGRNTRSVLVIGDGRNFSDVCQSFAGSNEYGYNLVDVVHHDDDFTTISNLETLVNQGKSYDECWICMPLHKSSVLKPVMYTLRHMPVNIRYMPGLQDLPLLNYKINKIGQYTALDISCSPMDASNKLIKRVSDLVIGGLILLLIAPVMLGVAMAVKLSSPGPVLFKQYRHGAGGRKVKVYKFRSMKVHQEEQGKVTQATKGDPRITPIGAFLRRTSLDELPQFLNVMQGRMSIVGPRPHALEHNEYYKELVESYMKRHNVKPGITGLAQVRGYRGETDKLEKMQRRVECDLEYINNWSLWLDIRIIFATVFKGFVNPNAY